MGEERGGPQIPISDGPLLLSDPPKPNPPRCLHKSILFALCANINPPVPHVQSDPCQWQSRAGLCLLPWLLPPSPLHHSFPRAAGVCFAPHKVTKHIKAWAAPPQTHKEAGTEVFFAVLTQCEQFSPCLQSCPPKTAWIRVFEKLILLQMLLGVCSPWPFHPSIIRISFLNSLAKFSIDL